MTKKLPLINLRVMCGNSFRAIATFGTSNMIDKSLAELCGIKDEGKILIEIGSIKREVNVKVADLSKMDLPIVPGLILSPSVFNLVCFYENFFEIGG